MPKTSPSKTPEQDRRKNAPRPEHELYTTPDLEAFLAEERRGVERARILTVKQQKWLWLKTVLVCGGLVLVLLGLALYDLLQTGGGA